jgi:hypothetical protein
MPVLSILLCSTGQLSLHLQRGRKRVANKYKWNDQINMYGQFLLDEFSLGILKGEITAGKINMVISWCQILQCIPH